MGRRKDMKEEEDDMEEEEEEDNDEEVQDLVEVGEGEVCSRDMLNALKEHIMLSLGATATVDVHKDNKNSIAFVSSSKKDKDHNKVYDEEDARLTPYKPVAVLPNPLE